MRVEELYTQMGFFVQTILADRYNRRELSGIIRKPVQLRIWNKKDFFYFCFLKGVIEVEIFVNIRRRSAVLIHIFDQIFVNFDQIFVNFAKIC